MTKFDRLALMASILCLADEFTKKGVGVSKNDLQTAAQNAVLLHRYLENTLERTQGQDQDAQPTKETAVSTRPPGLPEVAARERARHAIELLAQKGEDTQALEDVAFKLFLALEMDSRQQ